MPKHEPFTLRHVPASTAALATTRGALRDRTAVTLVLSQPWDDAGGVRRQVLLAVPATVHLPPSGLPAGTELLGWLRVGWCPSASAAPARRAALLPTYRPPQAHLPAVEYVATHPTHRRRGVAALLHEAMAGALEGAGLPLLDADLHTDDGRRFWAGRPCAAEPLTVAGVTRRRVLPRPFRWERLVPTPPPPRR